MLACLASHGYCQDAQKPNRSGAPSRVSEGAGRKVTLAALQEMITKSEAGTRSRAKNISPRDPSKFVADRTILSDLCMGGDQEEHDHIAEGVVICLIAVSRNAFELPLKRVYINLKGGKIIDLPLLATMPVEAAKTLKTDGTIGKNVWVGLYWAPKARTIEGEVFVDFASNRTRFCPGVDFPLPNTFGTGLKDKNPSELVINYTTMKELIEREYPGMVLTTSFLDDLKKVNPG